MEMSMVLVSVLSSIAVLSAGLAVSSVFTLPSH